jgi:hypothetical protein
MMPRVSLERWGGPSDDGQRWFEGRSLAIEWLGFMFELNLGRKAFGA